MEMAFNVSTARVEVFQQAHFNFRDLCEGPAIDNENSKERLSLLLLIAKDTIFFE